MSFLGDPLIQQQLRRLQMEATDDAGSRLDSLQAQVNVLSQAAIQTPPTSIQGILNMIRNGDHNHSVDTWFETAPTAGNELNECANVYAYPAINPITITDAVMTAGLGDINSVAGLFTPDMDGRYAIVRGAGIAGADLIDSVSYISSTHIVLSAASAAASGTYTATVNRQRLAHANTKNSGATVNDALKDSGHSNYGTNIQDPDWWKNHGVVRLGGTGITGYPLGHFADDGTTYVALHQLFAGREPFFRLNIARANQYVHIPGHLFVGLYNNNPEKLDWVKGSPFAVNSGVAPAPSTTVSTDYQVIIDTGQGYYLVSEVETVNAPDDAGFAGGSRVSLAWQYFAGAASTKIYRRRSGGNVYLMETIETGANTWTDFNSSGRVDTGSMSFPTYSEMQESVPSYWATAVGELDDLLYDGEPGKFWRPTFGRLPFVPSVNMAELFDPHLLIGLTEPLGTKLTDVVTNGTTAVTSAAAQFTAAMTGKAFTLTKSDGTAEVTGTFTYVSATSGTLSAAATWSENGSTLIIADSQPNGLLYDLVGLSLNNGEWDFHPEDNNRPQQAASNPNGSTQGSTSGGSGTSGGGIGGGLCVRDDVIMRIMGEENPDGTWQAVEVRSDMVTLSDRLWNGLGLSFDDFNPIDWIKISEVDEISWLLTTMRSLPCTKAHRVVNGPASYKSGVAVSSLKKDMKVLISDYDSTMLDSVIGLPVEKGRFRVVSFGLRKNEKLRTAHLMVTNDIISHNLKDPGLEPPVF